MKNELFLIFGMIVLFTSCNSSTDKSILKESHSSRITKLISHNNINKANKYAEFMADSTELRKLFSGDHNGFRKILEMEWIIQKDTLRFGQKSIQVVPNKYKIDTIYFKVDDQSGYDTLICNISEAKKYNFNYNTCCNGFNIYDFESNRMVKGSILLELSNAKESNKYLATLGEAGMIINNNVYDTIKVNCRSAMSPNIYNVSISQIKDCKNKEKCIELMCLQIPGINEFEYDYEYEVISEIEKFNYLPLSNNPLKINYDLEQGKIKNVW